MSLPSDAGQDTGGNLEASTLQYHLRAKNIAQYLTGFAVVDKTEDRR
jgi:hypothetical protein